MAKYMVHKGMVKTEIDADAVSVVTEDGMEVELRYRKSDSTISVSVSGSMVITPIAPNVIRISKGSR